MVGDRVVHNVGDPVGDSACDRVVHNRRLVRHRVLGGEARLVGNHWLVGNCVETSNCALVGLEGGCQDLCWIFTVLDHEM